MIFKIRIVYELKSNIGYRKSQTSDIKRLAFEGLNIEVAVKYIK